ncbi:hypothetical protein CBL_10063 [Carabus blaptoides fortunei]
MLQEKNAYLNSATNQLQFTKNYLLRCRSDESFEQVLVDAAVIAQELEIESNFDTEQVRKRRQKRYFQYEAQDEAPQDPKQKYKIDVAIQSIEERFRQLEQHNILFGFLYDIHNISKKKTTANILIDCKNLEKSLTHDSNRDIDANDLCSERQAVARRLPKSMPPPEEFCEEEV